MYVKKVKGYCPICMSKSTFISGDYWLRDNYKCTRCGSIPRQRSLMKVVVEHFESRWKEIMIHESSPSGPTFELLKSENKNYSFSYFYPEVEPGISLTEDGKCTNQNLEKMTFASDSFDLFITQDVFEHINNPFAAVEEIYRVLKPGGKHIFTVPLYPFIETRPRIKIENEKVIPIMEKIYHGNPIDQNGSLVTYDWGGDICKVIDQRTGFRSEVVEFPNSKENYEMGLEADFLYVVVSTKNAEQTEG